MPAGSHRQRKLTPKRNIAEKPQVNLSECSIVGVQNMTLNPEKTPAPQTPELRHCARLRHVSPIGTFSNKKCGGAMLTAEMLAEVVA